VGWLTNRRLSGAIGVCGALLLAPLAYFPGDCGDTTTGWSCNTLGYTTLYVGIAAAGLLATLVLIGLWRIGRRFARRFAKPS
jgi:hypothetical protein